LFWGFTLFSSALPTVNKSFYPFCPHSE
jgi:hypothetical protein